MYHYERWENDITYRFYEIRVYRDLLSDLVLVKIWGGKESQRGCMKSIVCSCSAEATIQIETTGKKRMNNGYKKL